MDTEAVAARANTVPDQQHLVRAVGLSLDKKKKAFFHILAIRSSLKQPFQAVRDVLDSAGSDASGSKHKSG